MGDSTHEGASGGVAEGGGVFALHLGSFLVHNAIIAYTLPLNWRQSVPFAILFTIAMGLHFVLSDRRATAECARPATAAPRQPACAARSQWRRSLRHRDTAARCSGTAAAWRASSSSSTRACTRGMSAPSRSISSRASAR